MTHLVSAHQSFWSGFNAPAEMQRFGLNDDPGWHLELQNDEAHGDLESWYTSDDRRSLLSEHIPSNSATVVAPPKHIEGLADRSWVETVDLAITTDRPEPIYSLAADVDLGDWGWAARQSLRLDAGTTDVPTEGVAVDEDATITTPADARNVFGRDKVTVNHSATVGAVIDTGLNTAGGDVFGSTARVLDASKDFTSDSEPTVGGAGLDAVADGSDSLHGTFVTSEIFADPVSENATYRGILHNADILALKALGDDGSGDTEAIARAVRYAADQGADFACMSLGSPIYSVELARAIEYAHEQGMICIVATGNDRQRTRWLSAPSSVETAISTAATTGDLPEEAKSAYFSNHAPHPGSTDFSGGKTNGAMVDFGAPGMKIEAKTPTTTGSVRTTELSGTSMAAPWTAGIVGLVTAATGITDVDEMRDRLGRTASRTPLIAEVEVGHGIPHAPSAIDNVETDQTQAEAMDQQAQTREEIYRGLSDFQGGKVYAALEAVPF